jgi:benzylsuccinate CoA-transferase BbsF subunit
MTHTLPLAGVNVLDLTWVMVGPTTCRYLADLGADVVKVESQGRVDPVRTLGPFIDHEPGIERSVSYHNFNAGKRSIALDMKQPDARRVLEPLIRWADVVVESFAPGAAGRLGLDEAGVRAIRPDVIMVSTSIGGVEWGGGVGTMGAAISGATHLVGAPGEPPVGPFGPWTDEVAPRFIASSIAAALRRRRLTGEGCFIDVAQAEAGIQFLLPALFAAALDGEALQPRPVDQPDPWRCPANAYRCADDRWVVIDAADEAAFASLRGAVDGALDDPDFATLVGRLRARPRVDQALGGWTSARDADEVEVQLQALGVPAHVACSTNDLGTDADLRAGSLVPVELPGGQVCDLVRRSFRTGPGTTTGGSDGGATAPGRGVLGTVRRGPLLGEHTDEVLREVCGFGDAEIAALTAGDVLR